MKQVRNFKGRCFRCDRSGVLAVDLVFRGDCRPRNLICNDCYDKHVDGSDPIYYLSEYVPIWKPPKKRLKKRG